MGSTGAMKMQERTIVEEPRVVSDGTHTFKVVNTVPDGYIVWNAGLIDGTTAGSKYLKLAKIAEGTKYAVDPNTLRAMQMPTADAKALQKGAGAISNFNSKAVQKYIDKYDKPNASANVKWKLNRLKAALPVMKKYGL